MNFKTRLAVKILNSGGVISSPTDTIQGLACLPKFETSMARLVGLKQRSSSKGLILLASDIKYFYNYVADVSLLEQIQVDSEPTTYLLKASQSTPKFLTGGFDTIAIRLSDNPLIVELCSATQSALVSSSANTSGKNSANTILKLMSFFKGKLDFIIAPTMDNNSASKIINLQTGERIR